MENELIAKDERSNIIQVLDDAMVKEPGYWKKYYRGNERETGIQAKYSLKRPRAVLLGSTKSTDAFIHLLKNLGQKPLPYSLLSQFEVEVNLNAEQVIEWKIGKVLKDLLDGHVMTDGKSEYPNRGLSLRCTTALQLKYHNFEFSAPSRRP